MNTIGILNFQSSNSKPLLNTLKALGYQASLISSPNSIINYDKLIIPGVGHIGALIHELENGGYKESILKHIHSGKFMLGICLGMHALTSGSDEDSHAKTLKVFSSEVSSMIPNPIMRVRVPHVGWNSVRYSEGHPLFKAIPQESDFYFVHSFAVTNVNNETFAVTEHGNIFSSAIGLGNVFGVQFHPEKSQKYGEKLLSNFCELSF